MTLLESLDAFARRFNENDRLRQMNRDWNRTIAIDVQGVPNCALVIEDGHMRVLPEVPQARDIALRAAEPVLVGIFGGELGPTEPYLDGRLTVQGSQEDVLRLDFLSMLIWGE